MRRSSGRGIQSDGIRRWLGEPTRTGRSPAFGETVLILMISLLVLSPG
jgi:hypothetical protein